MPSTITDLTGYTWIGNETINSPVSIAESATYNIDFSFNYITEKNATSYLVNNEGNRFFLNLMILKLLQFLLELLMVES